MFIKIKRETLGTLFAYLVLKEMITNLGFLGNYNCCNGFVMVMWGQRGNTSLSVMPTETKRSSGRGMFITSQKESDRESVFFQM